MPRRRRFRGRRRRGSMHVYHRGKPSIGILGGLAYGPAALIFGTQYFNEPVWATAAGPVQETGIRLQRLYLGYDPISKQWNFRNATGTLAIGAGLAAHALANWTGLNRHLARMKAPFRI